MDDLRRCFRCVFGALVDEGVFAFDLMTPEGFRRDYNGIAVIDTEDDLYVYRSIYDGAEKASSRMSGFVRRADGAWERYEEFRTATCFRLPAVLDALRE